MEIVETGEVVDATTPDQVLVSGVLEDGAVASVHVKADMANPTGHPVRDQRQGRGHRGCLAQAGRVAPVGIQRADLTLRLARGRKKEFVEAPVSEELARVPATVPKGAPFFTAQLYARLSDSLQSGVPLSPDFGAAVRRHRLLDAIQAASDTGVRQSG